MINSLLIDDEPKALEVLENRLNTYCPNIEIIGRATDPNEAYNLILNAKPQLIFLDIAMPGESGFDLLKRLPELDFEIIFVTGFNEYAIEAIKFSALGYVVKPILKEDLIEAVDLARRRIAQKMSQERNNEFLKNLMNPHSQRNRIGIPTVDGVELIQVSKIIRCEAMETYTKVCLTNNKSLVSSYNLGKFISLLEKFGFFSSHKSHLVNLEHVERYNKEGILELSDESIVPVARRRKAEFLKILDMI